MDSNYEVDLVGKSETLMVFSAKTILKFISSKNKISVSFCVSYIPTLPYFTVIFTCHIWNMREVLVSCQEK
jgi:hypothetical protein